MSDDISQSVSQRGNGAYDEENLRIQEVSNELQRLCRLHEEESGNGKANGKHGAVSAIPSKLENCRVATCEDQRSTRFEIEQRAAEQYAKSTGIWIPMDNVFDLGIPGPSGNESDTYVAKVRCVRFMNSRQLRPKPRTLRTVLIALSVTTRMHIASGNWKKWIPTT